MTDNEFETICRRLEVDPETLAEIRPDVEELEAELRRVYTEGDLFDAVNWIKDKNEVLSAEGRGFLVEILAGLFMYWEDEKARVQGGFYSEIEYKRIIDGVDLGLVPNEMWIYRWEIDRHEGLGIEDQIRSILNDLMETHEFTVVGIAHAVGMDKSSLGNFLNQKQSLDLHSVDLIVRHFGIVLTPLAKLEEVPYFDSAAGKRKGRSDKGKPRKTRKDNSKE